MVRVMKQSEGAVLAQVERERLKAFRMAEPLEAQIVMLREQAVLRGADTERLRASFEAEKRGLVQDLEQVKAHMLEVNKTREESDTATR